MFMRERKRKQKMFPFKRYYCFFSLAVSLSCPFSNVISSSFLSRFTLWDEFYFRIKEMLPSRFQLMSGPMTIIPGKEIKVPDTRKTGVLGFYLHCPENGEID